MDRRKFILGSSAGLLATSSLMSLSAFGCSTKKTVKSGHLVLRFKPYELKLKHAFNLAKSSRTTTPDVQVELEYDGIVGYGEASMPPYLGESVESVTKFLSSLDLTQFTDPFRMEEILAYVDSVAPNNRAAKASIDIALHDLLGKIMGQPWYKIWGLSTEKIHPTSFTISNDTPEVVQQKIKESEQYKVLKVKMGVPGDKELVETIRKATDRPLCVDANQGWNSKEYALEMCHWLKEKGCIFVEQPLPKEMLDETAWLREQSPLPIIADEAFQRLPDVVRFKDVYDGINIKLMKSTGLHEAYKMAVLAKSLGMYVMLGCMTETSCGIAAAAQLSPMVDWTDLDGNVLIGNDRFEGLIFEDGKVIPADKPGLGVSIIKGLE
ncbi:MAG: dipeptide epimerase [Muribaculaceae bacterium]|nr:dipeptide epimerase [Muribaculaceae bacterium]